ncbi:ribosome-binding factor A family protein, partial [Orientia tsutsugamushi str. Karp]
IRRMITQKINLKYSPELRIFYDYGFDNAANVDKILKSLINNRPLSKLVKVVQNYKYQRSN